MLGGEKRFNDLLCWALMVPLAALAMAAADLAVMALEVAMEGDFPGSARVWAVPLMNVCGGFAAVFMGAKVAPDHKAKAAVALALLYGAVVLSSAVLRATQGFGAVWIASFIAAGAAGSGAAAWLARDWKADEPDSKERAQG